MLAISPAVGVLYFELGRGTLNGERFSTYLDNLSEVIGDYPVRIIMDNVPAHRDAQMANEVHEIKFLPAYSPFLNPTENAFSPL